MIRIVSLALFATLAACGPSEAEQAEACSKGVPEAETDLAAGQCKYLIQARCFDDLATACTCAGCSNDCVVLESYPAVPACN